MKQYLLWLVIVATLGLSIYNFSHTKSIIEVNNPPATIINAQQSTPIASRAASSFAFNEIELAPVSSPTYPIHEGRIWFDGVHEALRFWGGNYTDGEEIPIGRYKTDVLTFDGATSDTLDFPALLNIGFDVSYELIIDDTINSATATIDIQDGYRKTPTDTVSWKSLSSDIFPHEFVNDTTQLRIYVANAVAYENRVIYNHSTASAGSFRILRKVLVMGKN